MNNEGYVRRRIEAITGILVLGFVLLVIRAVDLQWFQADKLRQLAENQRQREFSVPAPRGLILDIRGRVLAKSIRIPSISAIADEVPTQRIGVLARALGMWKTRLAQHLHGRRGFIWLARQIRPDIARRVMALHIPGVRQEMEWRRYNPLGPATGHLLGFVGVDGHGLEGLEYSMDAQLAGSPGRMQVRHDARGISLPGDVWLAKPRRGRQISLYLDATIQSLAYAALAEGVRIQRAKGGSVVVMRPDDGAVLAMVSWPGFNPNDFHRYRPSQWRDRAITDMFEPGSVLKPFTIAAALETGRWKRTSRIFCENGHFRVANDVIHDDHPEGWLDMSGILARSSNICAAKLALDTGPKRLHRMLQKIGLGRRTGIGISGESPGILLPAKRWGPVETATIAFGQGVAVTSLQLATAFSVLANGGVHVSPKIIEGRAYEKSYRVMPRHIARTVLQMLIHAASPEGTGALAVPAGYRVAGKTGTAQQPDGHDGYAKGKFTAVFAGAVPANDPRLVIAVMVDEPRKSIYGGRVAAPIFRHIAAAVLPYLGVFPRKSAQHWQSVDITAHASSMPKTKGALPSLYGKSLREVRKLAFRSGYQLHTHGSGWVIRQKPVALSQTGTGSVLEVWLHE